MCHGTEAAETHEAKASTSLMDRPPEFVVVGWGLRKWGALRATKRANHVCARSWAKPTTPDAVDKKTTPTKCQTHESRTASQDNLSEIVACPTKRTRVRRVSLTSNASLHIRDLCLPTRGTSHHQREAATANETAEHKMKWETKSRVPQHQMRRERLQLRSSPWSTRWTQIPPDRRPQHSTDHQWDDTLQKAAKKCSLWAPPTKTQNQIWCRVQQVQCVCDLSHRPHIQHNRVASAVRTRTKECHFEAAQSGAKVERTLAGGGWCWTRRVARVRSSTRTVPHVKHWSEECRRVAGCLANPPPPHMEVGTVTIDPANSRAWKLHMHSNSWHQKKDQRA